MIIVLLKRAALFLDSELVLAILFTSGSPIGLWINPILLTSGSPFRLWINPILPTSGSPFSLWISLILLTSAQFLDSG